MTSVIVTDEMARWGLYGWALIDSDNGTVAVPIAPVLARTDTNDGGEVTCVIRCPICGEKHAHLLTERVQAVPR
jgi:hypothetical protein